MSGSRLTHAECRHLLSDAAFGRVVLLRDDRIVVELAELIDICAAPVMLVPPGTSLAELCAEACAAGTALTLQTERIDRAAGSVRSVALTGVPAWIVARATLRACAVAAAERHGMRTGLRFMVLCEPSMHGHVYPLHTYPPRERGPAGGRDLAGEAVPPRPPGSRRPP
ncbi:MAG: hypothetical protein HOV68_12900, partial [Streptomycetaceae bacterium]|nr:hypothetical protein [Streptomycetaceae bacterium]